MEDIRMPYDPRLRVLCRLRACPEEVALRVYKEAEAEAERDNTNKAFVLHLDEALDNYAGELPQ